MQIVNKMKTKRKTKNNDIKWTCWWWRWTWWWRCIWLQLQRKQWCWLRVSHGPKEFWCWLLLPAKTSKTPATSTTQNKTTQHSTMWVRRRRRRRHRRTRTTKNTRKRYAFHSGSEGKVEWNIFSAACCLQKKKHQTTNVPQRLKEDPQLATLGNDTTTEL